MDYGTVNVEESAEEYQDELTVEQSRDQWAKRHWSLLALKELQVEMEFQDQAIGQRGQRLHGGTGLGEIGGTLGSYRRSGLQKLLEPLEQSEFQTAEGSSMLEDIASETDSLARRPERSES